MNTKGEQGGRYFATGHGAATGAPVADLASHFLECGTLNTNITLAPGERIVITDDLLEGRIFDLSALSMAAVVARDGMVGRAAIIPLAQAASRQGRKRRQRFERLFELIEESAFDEGVRESAEHLVHASFREAEIRDLARELGGTVGPARLRYRAFLDVVRQLTLRKIPEDVFIEEFLDFTRQVAGKLDFGIYAVCVDRMFTSARIPVIIKVSVLREVLRFPPLVRKELVTNLLSSPHAAPELVRHARHELAGAVSREQLTEIFLFTTLKLAWAAQRAPQGRAAA